MIRRVVMFCALVCSVLGARAQMSREDSIMMYRSAEIDFVVDQIENSYIFGRRGISDDEWDRRVQIVRDKILSVKLDSAWRRGYPYAHSYALRYFGLLIEDSHFKFPDGGVYNRSRVFSKADTLLPLWIKSWDDGTVYCVKDYTGTIPQNAQILSVNGHSAQDASLLNRKLFPGEERNAMLMMNRWHEPDIRNSKNFSNYFHMEFIRSPYTIEYVDKNQTKTVVLKGMAREDIHKAFKRGGGKQQAKKIKGPGFFGKCMRYEKVNDSIAVLTIDSFWGLDLLELMIWDADNVYADNLKNKMRRISQDKIKHLIIDISRNGGGMADNIYKTLNYFTDQPVERNETYLLTKDNRQILRTVIASGDHRYMGVTKEQLKEFQTLVDSLPDGTMFSTDTLHNLIFTPTNVKHKYQGKAYLITSAYTFSAAQIFAQQFKQLNIGLTVGQPSGGYSSVSGGNCARVVLPYSPWMDFDVPYCRVGKKSDPLRYDYDKVDIPIEIKKEDWLNNREKEATVTQLIEMIKTSKVNYKPYFCLRN